MARLPVPGSDDNAWGDILNDFLSVEHNADGTLKDAARPADLAAKADAADVVHKGEQVISVLDYGAVGNNSTDNTTAIQNAINAAASAGKPLLFPGGTFRHGSLTLPNRVTIRGTSRAKTILSFTGSGTAFVNATPGVRIFDIHMSDIGLLTSTGAIGYNLDSVSTSTFTNMSVTGFSDAGFYIHSTVSGGAVYNRFNNVSANSCATGFKLRGSSSNANIWNGCRAVNNSVAGWDLRDCNDNTVDGCQAEGCGTGFYVDGSVLGGCDYTRIRDCRVEACTTGVNVASSNVRYTTIDGLWGDGSNGTVIADSGTSTRRASLLMSAQTTNSIVRLDSGWQFVSGGSVTLGGTSSQVTSTTNTPLYLNGKAPDSASAVGTWIGNGSALNTSGARIVGFSKDTAVTHASPASYVGADGSYEFAGSGVKVMSGAGSPEGVVTAVVGSLWLRNDGGANTTVFRKESGTGNTGWVALSSPVYDVQTFTSNGTWNKPAGAQTITVYAVSGGGGGGSGARGAAGTARSGGGGGAGGSLTQASIPAAMVADSVAITVATGGVGGAAVTTDNTAGNPGTSGGPASSFGFYIQANGNFTNHGSGGGLGVASTGGGNSGSFFPGISGGASPAVGGAGTNVSLRLPGGGGGGGGGGISAANVPAAGAAGRQPNYTLTTPGAGGTAPNGAGGDATNTTAGTPYPASGGGGGAAGDSSNPGGNGGHGGTYGGGGGGGGASFNGFASGAGGNGGPGIVVVITT